MHSPPHIAPIAPPQGHATGPMVLRIGLVVAGGVLTALVSSLPAALRMGDDASVARAIEQWLVLGAIATPLAILAVLAIARAKVGLRVLAGERAVSFSAGFLWWCTVEIALLAAVGSVLRKTTHNHALAGVAFAFFALLSGAVVALLARRVTVVLDGSGPAAPRSGLSVAAACAALVVLLVAVRTGRADDLHTAGGIVDAVLFAGLATLASSPAFARSRPLAIAGLPVAILVVIAGLTTLALDPKLRDSLTVTAPIHGLVIDLFR